MTNYLWGTVRKATMSHVKLITDSWFTRMRSSPCKVSLRPVNTSTLSPVIVSCIQLHLYSIQINSEDFITFGFSYGSAFSFLMLLLICPTMFYHVTLQNYISNMTLLPIFIYNRKRKSTVTPAKLNAQIISSCSRHSPSPTKLSM